VASSGLRFVNDSEVVSRINDEEQGEAMLRDGDQVRIGPMLFETRITDDDETRPGLPPLSALSPGDDAPEVGEAGTEGGRTSRRISASRMSPVEPAEEGTKSLFRRVGAVVRRGPREDRPADLVALEDRRDRLLLDVGRLALEHQGGFGLGPDVFAALLRGEEINLGPGKVAASMLDAFRRNVEICLRHRHDSRSAS